MLLISLFLLLLGPPSSGGPFFLAGALETEEIRSVCDIELPTNGKAGKITRNF